MNFFSKLGKPRKFNLFKAPNSIVLTMHIGVIRWQSCAPVPLLYPTRAKQPVPPVWMRMKSRSEFRLGVKRMQLALVGKLNVSFPQNV